MPGVVRPRPKRSSGPGSGTGRHGAKTRRRAVRRLVRKLLFFALVLAASVGMGYMVSFCQPGTEQAE
jgi:hypothetical protein